MIEDRGRAPFQMATRKLWNIRKAALKLIHQVEDFNTQLKLVE
jgi:hypothetical protein